MVKVALLFIIYLFIIIIKSLCCCFSAMGGLLAEREVKTTLLRE